MMRSCGKGETCYLADGTKSCTCTVQKYEVMYGKLKHPFAPIYGLDPHPPTRHWKG